jgi:hypothetical protein
MPLPDLQFSFSPRLQVQLREGDPPESAESADQNVQTAVAQQIGQTPSLLFEVESN